MTKEFFTDTNWPEEEEIVIIHDQNDGIKLRYWMRSPWHQRIVWFDENENIDDSGEYERGEWEYWQQIAR